MQRLDDGGMQAMDVVSSTESPGLIRGALKSRTVVFVCGGILAVLGLVLAGLVALPPPNGSAPPGAPWTVSIELTDSDLYHMHQHVTQSMRATTATPGFNMTNDAAHESEWKFVIRELAGTPEWSLLRMQLHNTSLITSEVNVGARRPARVARGQAAGSGADGNDTDAGWVDQIDWDDVSEDVDGGLGLQYEFEEAYLNALRGHTFLAKLGSANCVWEHDDANLNATVELALERFVDDHPALSADSDAAGPGLADTAFDEDSLRAPAAEVSADIQRNVFDFLLSTPADTETRVGDPWTMPRRMLGGVLVNVTFVIDELLESYTGLVHHDPYPGAEDGEAARDTNWLLVRSHGGRTTSDPDEVMEALSHGQWASLKNVVDLFTAMNSTKSDLGLTYSWNGTVVVGAQTGIVLGGNTTVEYEFDITVRGNLTAPPAPASAARAAAGAAGPVAGGFAAVTGAAVAAAGEAGAAAARGRHAAPVAHADELPLVYSLKATASEYKVTVGMLDKRAAVSECTPIGALDL